MVVEHWWTLTERDIPTGIAILVVILAAKWIHSWYKSQEEDHYHDQ